MTKKTDSSTCTEKYLIKLTRLMVLNNALICSLSCQRIWLITVFKIVYILQKNLMLRVDQLRSIS